MGNQFNFYQFDKTGSGLFHWVTGYIGGGPPVIIGGVCQNCLYYGPSLFPPINAIASDFTGVYFPSDILEGVNVGFVWRIKDDDDYYPTTYRIKISGQQNKSDNEITNINIGYSGNFFPVTQDSGTLVMNYSGDMTGNYTDVPTFVSTMTGNFTGNYTDTPVFSILISGNTSKDNIDIPIYTTTFTGKFESGTNLTVSLTISISGIFFKNNKDTSSIDVNFISISYDVGGHHLTIFSGDTASIDMSLVNIFYK